MSVVHLLIVINRSMLSIYIGAKVLTLIKNDRLML
jgi:hypothetical protein